MRKWVKGLLGLGAGLFVCFLAVVCYAYFIEPDRLVVNEFNIRVDGWNKAFDGLNIVVIGDIQRRFSLH